MKQTYGEECPQDDGDVPGGQEILDFLEARTCQDGYHCRSLFITVSLAYFDECIGKPNPEYPD
eukprot:4746537-Karenia_brevis.AAC.1